MYTNNFIVKTQHESIRDTRTYVAVLSEASDLPFIRSQSLSPSPFSFSHFAKSFGDIERLNFEAIVVYRTAYSSSIKVVDNFKSEEKLLISDDLSHEAT